MESQEMTRAEFKKKGGFKASTFVFALASLESMGFVANMVSLVLYFLTVMYFDISTSANTLTNFMGATFLLSLLSGFISDTFLNRFSTCLIFGLIEVVGLALFTIQAHEKKLLPEFCGFGKSSCVKGGKAVMLYASLTLLALGSGGVKGTLPALGGDQFDHKDPKQEKALASYFNWLLLSTTIGASVGVTGIVYLSTEKKEWAWGFFISTVATFIGFVVLAFGKHFYRIREPILSESPMIRIAQVIVAAFKNRRLALPENSDELYETTDKEKELKDRKIAHTNQFRFLDKAAIVQKDTEPTPWTLCTVTQVEEVKILTRMLPILFSTIIMNTCLAQLQTFSIDQGNTMDRRLGSIQVPAASIPVIPLAFMSILIPMYEYLFVPFARKITQHPSGITQLQRVGVGLVLSAISMAVAGIVEVKRRKQALKDITKPIGLFWLSFQYGIFGIADMFTLVGLLEFFYREAPAGMRSLSTSFTWLSLSFGYFLSTVFVNIINSVTKRIAPSKHGWLHGLDLNYNNLNLFYWFLAVLSCINFLNYLFWASWYKYKAEEDEHSHSQAEASGLKTRPLLAKEETALESAVIETNKAPSSVQTEDIAGQQITSHSQAEPNGLKTGPLLAKEETTLESAVIETNKVPSSVQTEDIAGQQVTSSDDKTKGLETGPLMAKEKTTVESGATETNEALSSVQTEQAASEQVTSSKS